MQNQRHIPHEASELAAHFASLIHEAQTSLKAVGLLKYADEVLVMLPQTAGDFERLAYWADALSACLTRWAGLPEVQAKLDPNAVHGARTALAGLSQACRSVRA